MKTHTTVALALVAMLVAAGCAVSEERGGPGADEVPQVSGSCAEDHPDCEDTGINPPTGGDTPLADPGADQTGGFVIEGRLSIADATAYEGDEFVAVQGFVVTSSGKTQFCEALAESFPPQCGGLSLTITNPEALANVVLLEEGGLDEGGVQWSPDAVTLLGHVSAGEFTVATASA